MKSVPFSHIRKSVLLLSLLILTGGVGYRLGEMHAFGPSIAPSQQAEGALVNTDTPPSAEIDFSLFWDVWQRLFRYYIDKDALDKQKMVWGAIQGMVGALDDPYTAFLPPKENEEFKDDLGGSFEGIGAELGLRDGRIIVVSPLKGHPAESAGLRPGDYILKVDGEDTTGWTIQEAVATIRGPKGTTVVLEILHEGDRDSGEIAIVRDMIVVPSVTSWIKTPQEIEEISGLSDENGIRTRNERVAYLELTRFGDRTNTEWNVAVGSIASELASSNPPKGLILDLRNNPGGYLAGSVYIASEFVSEGIVVSQVNSDGTKDDYQVIRRGRLLSVPLIVLLNKGSASASEIVAGALRDFSRATLVGETSFGKGTVQTPQDLPGGAGLHITTGKWLLPSGGTISDTGISPDVVVEMETYDATGDAQLAKAIELILQ